MADDEVNKVSSSSIAQSDVPESPEANNPTDELNLVSSSFTAQSDFPASPEATKSTDEVSLVSSSFTLQSDGPKSPEAINSTDEKKAWHESITEDLQRTAGSALQSARSLQLNPSSHLRTLQDLLPHAKSQFQTYEDAFFKKVKDQLMSASEHPAVAGGVAITAALVLMRGPRRFLFRQTLGRFQSEEAHFLKAEKNVKELILSTDLVKKDSRKLFERVALAEKEMKRGNDELMNAGRQIQRLVKSVYKVETQANDLIDGLREIPGREALKLRAEVASMASALRQQRIAQDKRLMRISDLGLPI